MYQQNYKIRLGETTIDYILPKMAVSDKNYSKFSYYNQQVNTISGSSESRGPSSPSAPFQSSEQQWSLTSSTHWNTNFKIACIPFLFWGFPIHLLFRKRRILSLREWLKYLCPCSAPCTSLLTLAMAISTIVLNAFMFYMFGYIFNGLLITGVLGDVFITMCIDFVRLAPVVVPLDLFWLKGYHIRNFIASFDRFSSHLQNIIIPLNDDKKVSISSCRPQFAFLYFIVFCIHILHVLVDLYDDSNSNANSNILWNRIWSYIFEYSIAVMMTLIFPLYCVFCWAVRHELLSLVEFIKILISTKVAPNFIHFDEFKRCYRKIGDDIMFINNIFSIYLSVVGFVLGIYVYSEAEHFFVLISNAFLPGMVQLFAKAFGGASGTETTTTATSVTTEFTPFRIRLAVAEAFILIFYVVLFGLTYWQAVKVNDEVRFLHVWLNDFVTEPSSRLSVDLFNGFHYLKWYIHSRLEQEKPAFLNIMALGFVPFMKTRLIQYRVVH